MVFASEPLAVLDLHHLPGPWMERIENTYLERRTPGIVTLLSSGIGKRRVWLGLESRRPARRTCGSASMPAAGCW